ncbi:hypothetical protein HGRIS_008652 [Hohenbuehelia grisea]|uniref:Uncharacterized protein n=1 Tax=Hohenbuehelia grisea TaxID=104357 RepID=A0ABR3J8M7_9AGAR
MSDAEVYARQLLPKRHGYPLWSPEPYGHSSTYRTKGVRIGDVGYITHSGAFETLFNIRAAPDDLFINCHGVPDGFEPIKLADPDIVHTDQYHTENATITSASSVRRGIGAGVGTSQNPLIPAGGGLNFECSWKSSQGGILHLPQGGSRLDAPRTHLFMEHAIQHAREWYHFANHTLQRGISNDALYLVTGCDKASSWMVGSFSEIDRGRQVQLYATAAGLGEARVSYSYSWSSTAPATYRVGPAGDAMSGLSIRPNDMVSYEALAKDGLMFGVDAPKGQNQCLFIRGFRLSLRQGIVSRLLRRLPSVAPIPIPHGLPLISSPFKTVMSLKSLKRRRSPDDKSLLRNMLPSKRIRRPRLTRTSSSPEPEANQATDPSPQLSTSPQQSTFDRVRFAHADYPPGTNNPHPVRPVRDALAFYQMAPMPSSPPPAHLSGNSRASGFDQDLFARPSYPESTWMVHSSHSQATACNSTPPGIHSTPPNEVAEGGEKTDDDARQRRMPSSTTRSIAENRFPSVIVDKGSEEGGFDLEMGLEAHRPAALSYTLHDNPTRALAPWDDLPTEFPAFQEISEPYHTVDELAKDTHQGIYAEYADNPLPLQQTVEGPREDSSESAIRLVPKSGTQRNWTALADESPSELYHPSILFNHKMLDSLPDAEVAVTHDDVWCSLVHEVRTGYLLQRLTSTASVVTYIVLG